MSPSVRALRDLSLAPAPDYATRFPALPLGQAADMGHAADGTPLIDPQVFDAPEFFRNPYPYYQLLRDHHPVFHDKLEGILFAASKSGYSYPPKMQKILTGFADQIAWHMQQESRPTQKRHRSWLSL